MFYFIFYIVYYIKYYIFYNILTYYILLKMGCWSLYLPDEDLSCSLTLGGAFSTLPDTDVALSLSDSLRVTALPQCSEGVFWCEKEQFL